MVKVRDSRAAPAATYVARPAAERNPGTALDLDWVRDLRVNRSAVERRADTLVRRRTVKRDWQ
ncbi:MAG: deoxyribose-phosphate aldolase, partial [Gemmatimonadota bacterium]|nr:deoxyribose-phosphate aldolase [Gemmatimonadota bacterium]